MRVGIPLAWLQLAKEKLRLLVAVAGVAFAVILIFMQLGFRNALFESATRVHEALAGDLFLVSPQFDFLAQPKSFSRRRLLQALGYPGVESVSPLYLGLALWKNPETGKSRTIFSVGVDPADNPLKLPGVSEQLGLIQKRDVVLYDRSGRPEYGNIAAALDGGHTLTTEVNNRGPYLYWKLDETGNAGTAADASGNNRTGSYSPNGNAFADVGATPEEMLAKAEIQAVLREVVESLPRPRARGRRSVSLPRPDARRSGSGLRPGQVVGESGPWQRASGRSTPSS